MQFDSLCEMHPDTEFLLVRIFPHSNWMRRDTSYLSVFSPNAGKYGPEKTPYLDTFHAVHINWVLLSFTILISLVKILIISILWIWIKSQIIEIHNALLTMLKLFPQIYTENPIMFPKIVTKTVYIRKRIKIFRFHMNPQKNFPLWITDSFCSVFVKLWPQSETIYNMQVRTLSGKVWKCLRIHHESAKVCISVNVLLEGYKMGTITVFNIWWLLFIFSWSGDT